uniref:AAA+ ATPase domain-containing protein n=1 Tax=viral metagenome TaxID=1070528 RepID=A0A6C0KZ64_9ZZZZ|tara:strand:- start:16549 stop:17436 length:888 start_codon:yes stop_codon:yes gene_type:complete
MSEQPWIEKYRPQALNDIVLNYTNKTILNNMINTNNFSNVIFYGPPGTGKTTTILCLMNEYCALHHCSNNYIHLNASHERGIDVIRNQIFNFTEKKNLFSNVRKFVLLDEIDSMTKQAQNNLHIVINKCKNNVTFILICNFLNRVIESLRGSFIILHFNKTSSICDEFIKKCIKSEKLKISKEKLKLIKSANSHDLRSVLNQLQNYDKNDILFDVKTFLTLLEPSKNHNYLLKITKTADIKSLFCFFFNYLYEQYGDQMDQDIIFDMKLLLVVNSSAEYFVYKFIPKLIKKLNLG